VVRQATLLYATFQVMRGRPIDLAESARIGLGRFIVGTAIIVPLLAGLASLLLVFPGFMLYTMWFDGDACLRGRETRPGGQHGTQPHADQCDRWKIFGLFVLLGFIFGAGEGVVALIG
jgi:hypothetical protein